MIPEKSDVIPSAPPVAPASAPAATTEETPALATDSQLTLSQQLVRWLGLLLIFGVVAFSVWLLFNPIWIARFGSWGYLGAFLVNLLASASILLPIPGLPVAIAMGVSMNPLLLALAAAAGSAIGELAGYAMGVGGRALSNDEKISKWAPRIEDWTRKYGPPAIFVVAALPLPFDFAGIAAGAGKMSLWQFMAATFLGKFVKYYIVILVASGSLAGVRDMLGW